MLYFRMVTVPDLSAVTHVDGSARVQTVTSESNEPLYDLLSAFAERTGVGVLCNTSLNFKGSASSTACPTSSDTAGSAAWTTSWWTTSGSGAMAS